MAFTTASTFLADIIGHHCLAKARSFLQQGFCRRLIFFIDLFEHLFHHEVDAQSASYKWNYHAENGH